MIELDGSYGEGGGALVRTALALSTLTNQPFKIKNIRTGRPQPGLKAQHLEAIKALKEICSAKTNEITLGTTELSYQPGKVKKGTYNFDIGTAGSITLFLQAIIFPCLFASGKVTLVVKGGTCGKWQASVDYLQNILLPHLQRFVEKIELKIFKRGYFPKGGGEIRLEISPRFKLKKYDNFAQFNEDLSFRTAKINLTKQGKLEQIRGIINVSRELERKEVAERIKKVVENSLKEYGTPINVRIDYTQSLSVGGEVLLWGLFSNDGLIDFDNPVILGASNLIDKNKSSEKVGQEVAEKLKEIISSNKAIDNYLADQLIIFMSLLYDSKINVNKITKHTKTNIYVTEQFLHLGFKIDGNNIVVKKKIIER